MTSLPGIFKKPVHAILILALLQVLSSTCLLKIDGFHAANSLLFLLCGAGISFFLLKVPSLKIEKKLLLNKQVFVKLIFILLLLPVSYYLSQQIMNNTPLEKEHADMLPIMKVMGERFVGGYSGQVYEPIPEIWNGIQPIYLPAMWLPFTSSLLFHFDMRWVTVCGIWISVFISIWPGKWKGNVFSFLFIAGIFLLLAWLHLEKTNNVIRLTEEGVIFFYYSLMAVAIISGNPWLLGLGAALCLLSRYAIIGWIPFAGAYLLFKQQYRFFFKAFTAGLATVVLLLLPFGIMPLLLHLHLPAEYIHQSERVWTENPEFFYQSLGMAKFFGAGNTRLLHYILLTGTFAIPLLFLFFIRKRIVPLNIALLSCFQLSITFFYSFLDVSYLYLYYTPVFISLTIAGWLLAAEGNSEKRSMG
ncbi:MAG: hypothetical protein HZB42_14815 [Sphingobacteriales bacterium]|nr:hypothetical protein [Sphingobacteriales bacterium]